MTHSVYYLFDAEGMLIYVGRGKNPSRRRYDFEHRTGISVSLVVFRKFVKFEHAQACELRQIAKHRPPHNSYLASSPCMLGHRHTDATKAKIAAAHKASQHAVGNKHALGYKHTDETRVRMSEKASRRLSTPEANAKRSAALKGRKRSAEVVENMKRAQQRRRAESSQRSV